MITYRVEVAQRSAIVSENRLAIMQAAQQAGHPLSGLHGTKLYFIQGELSEEDVDRLARILLTDPVTEISIINNVTAITELSSPQPDRDSFTVEIALHPGVIDPPAENLVRAAHKMGLTGVEHAATGHCFYIQGNLNEAAVRQLAVEILVNPLLQRFTINQPITPILFPIEGGESVVETIYLRAATDGELLVLSRNRRLSLPLAELQAVQAYFQAENREATDVELESIAQAWRFQSAQKPFTALIEYTGADGTIIEVDGILNSVLRTATTEINKSWVRSALTESPGIIAYDDHADLAFTVATGQASSAFANPDIDTGHVIHEILSVNAQPIAHSDVLCLGPPLPSEVKLAPDVRHPALVTAEVIAKTASFSQQLGIPTVNGSAHYHADYAINPLVHEGCLGMVPRNSHLIGAQPHDLIVAIGGSTGHDRFSGSARMHPAGAITDNEMGSTTVQNSHRLLEKQVKTVILRAREEQLYHALAGCGAGGFSAAIRRLGAEIGARVQLGDMDLHYLGLRPWERWVSATQGLMVLAVPACKLTRLRAVCAAEEVALSLLGTFEPTGLLEIYDGDRLAGRLPLQFLHHGRPRTRLQAKWQPPAAATSDAALKPPISNLSPPVEIESTSPNELLLRLLAHPDIRSKEDIIRQFDHEVQGGTAVKPLVGSANHGPSDAAVLIPIQQRSTAVDSDQLHADSDHPAQKSVALANGICPPYTALDPARMAYAAIDEAIRNVVAVGADPDHVALLANFSWENPDQPERLGSLVRGAQGCREAAIAYQTPILSARFNAINKNNGPSSFPSIMPGTLLISALGMVPDGSRTVTMDLKQAGNFLVVVGETRAELGGSHYALVGGDVQPQHRRVPQSTPQALGCFRAVHRAIQAGLVQACHDCAEGGLAVTLAEMCLAGDLGTEIKLMSIPRDAYWSYSTPEAILFSQSLSRLVLEVRPSDMDQLAQILTDVPTNCVGVIGGAALRINDAAGRSIVNLPVTALEQAWRGHLTGNRESLIVKRNGPTPKSAGERRSPVYNSPSVRQRPKILILRAPGTNRDVDAAHACEMAGGTPEIVHVNQLTAGEWRLSNYGMLVIPGGFSYGDDFSAGVLWSIDLQYRLQEQLRAFARDGRPILGIGNGFQVLVKAGLLPGSDQFDTQAREMVTTQQKTVTLTQNQSGRFECRWVYIQPNPDSPSLFTQGMTEPIYCPVAHHQGRLAVADGGVLANLRERNLIALSYKLPPDIESTEGAANLATDDPAHPNGSPGDIAGLCNSFGNVLGLMPHPENHIFPWQHPRYHRGERGLDGLRLFTNGVQYTQKQQHG